MPEQGPDWFLVAIEAFGGRTSDLLCSLKFLGYMDIYIGGRSRSVVQRGAHEGGGRAQGVGVPPASWLPRRLLDVLSKSSGSRLFQKSRSRRFHSVWTPFDIPFLRNTEIGKKTAICTGPWVNMLVPKII